MWIGIRVPIYNVWHELEPTDADPTSGITMKPNPNAYILLCGQYMTSYVPMSIQFDLCSLK